MKYHSLHKHPERGKICSFRQKTTTSAYPNKTNDYALNNSNTSFCNMNTRSPASRGDSHLCRMANLIFPSKYGNWISYLNRCFPANNTRNNLLISIKCNFSRFRFFGICAQERKGINILKCAGICDMVCATGWMLGGM